MSARAHLASRGLGLLLLLLVLFAAGPAWAQGSATVGVGTTIPAGPALPIACNPASTSDAAHFYYLTSGANPGLYSCTAVNTWSLGGGASTGAANTWTADQFFKSGRPYVDVRAYGAVGDNATDDTAALQAAVSAAQGNQGSYPPFQNCKNIYVPPGEYKIASPEALHLKGYMSGCVIFGAGRLASVLNFTYDTAPIATTAATLTSNVATFTMASNPVTAGYAANQLANVTGFTGADTYFNDYCFITAVSTTQVTCTKAVSHANGTATSNGTVNIGYAVYNSEPQDGSLIYPAFRDIGFAGPGGAGSHNLSFVFISSSAASGPPADYNVRVQGFQTGWEIGPNANNGAGGFAEQVGLSIRDVNVPFHILNGQVTPNVIVNADICTSTAPGAAIWLYDGLASQEWDVDGYLCTQSATGAIVKVSPNYNGAPNSTWNGHNVHFELYGGGSSTAQFIDGTQGNLSHAQWNCSGCDMAVVQGTAGRSIVTLTDKEALLWEGGSFSNSVTLTADGNAGALGQPTFSIENAWWGTSTCTAAANITVSSPNAGNNPIYRTRHVRCPNNNPDMMPDTDFGYPGQSTISNHDFKTRRYFANQGTAVANGDISISAGWGTGAAVSATSGFDQSFTFTVTAGTTPAANPTFSLTFKDGTWTNVPVVMCKMAGGTGIFTNIVESTTTATQLNATFLNTPVATNTYIINCIGFGK